MQSAIEFLDLLSRGLPEDEKVLIASYAGDLANGVWHTRPYVKFDGMAYVGAPDQNNYSCVMSSKIVDESGYARKKRNFGHGLCLMIDDLGDVDANGQLIGKGAKHPISMVDCLPPTALIETSPNNYQAVYMFDEPIASQTSFEKLIEAFIRRHYKSQGLTEPGQAGITRAFRIPYGVNGKDKYKDNAGNSPAVKLTQFNPSARYSPKRLAEAFDLMGTIEQMNIEYAERDLRLEQDPEHANTSDFYDIVNMFAERGMIIRDESDEIKVVCPWEHMHSGIDDTGTKLIRPSEHNGHQGTYFCNHGSCRSMYEGRAMLALKMWLTSTDSEAASEVVTDRLKSDLDRHAERDRLAADLRRQEAAAIARMLIPEDPVMSTPPAPVSTDQAMAMHNYGSELNVITSTKDMALSEYRHEWVIKKIFAKGTVNFIYGGSYTGKTYVALDMAHHIANGVSYFGQRTKQHKVVYIAAEAANTITPRIKALLDAKPAPEPFYVMPEPLPMSSPHPEGSDGYNAYLDKMLDFVEVIKNLGDVGMIIFDTLSTSLSADTDENNNNIMAAVIAGFRQLAMMTNAAIVIVHHTGKSKENGMRGATALFANADSVISVTNRDGEVIPKCEKNKVGGDVHFGSFTFGKVILGYDEDGDPVEDSFVTYRHDDSPTIQPKVDLTSQTKVVEMAMASKEESRIAQAMRNLFEHLNSNGQIHNTLKVSDICTWYNELREANGEKPVLKLGPSLARMVKKGILFYDGRQYGIDPNYVTPT